MLTGRLRQQGKVIREVQQLSVRLLPASRRLAGQIVVIPGVTAARAVVTAVQVVVTVLQAGLRDQAVGDRAVAAVHHVVEVEKDNLSRFIANTK